MPRQHGRLASQEHCERAESRRLGLFLCHEGSRQPEGEDAAITGVAGLEAASRLMAHVETEDPAEAVAPARRLLSTRDRPTAIVAQTDGVAIGVIRAAREMGLRVPDEISIIGYNDQAEAAQADPPLTTFACPREEHGRTAVEMLLAASEGRYSSPQRRVLTARLVVRGSTAPR